MTLRIPKGSSEVLYIAVTDKMEQLINLDAATITYQVLDNESDVDLATPIDSGSCTNEGMTVVTSPIDTAGFEEGPYRLYLTMLLGSEDIKLGPFQFIVG